jgi:excisionase family DNA binding protein
MENHRLSTDVHGVSLLTSLSVGKVKQLIYSGELPSFTVGRRRLIAVDAVREFIARKSAQRDQTAGGLEK